jgi:hypothetical protein
MPNPSDILPPQTPVTFYVSPRGHYYHVVSRNAGIVHYVRMSDETNFSATEARFNELMRHDQTGEGQRQWQAMQNRAMSPPPVAAIPNSLPGAITPEAENDNPEGQDNREVGVLVEPTEHDTFENLILPDVTVTRLRSMVSFLESFAEADRIFHLGEIDNGNKNSVVMYGPPGTGKTKAARAIAKMVNKKLLIVDYAAMISCYVGETAKNIRAAFRRAREMEAILFFDEADSLCSRRVGNGNMDRSHATSINQNRNVLMQEIDRYEGIVIFCTNLFENFEPALVRRIADAVEFTLPDASARSRIFRLHVRCEPDRLGDVNFDELGTLAEGLAGGDILTVIRSVIRRIVCASRNPQDWNLSQRMIIEEICSVQARKRANESSQSAPRRRPVALTPAIAAPQQV